MLQLSVCVCVVPSKWYLRMVKDRAMSLTAKTSQASLDSCLLRIGRRLMTPLSTHRARSPAEALIAFQVKSISAHRARRNKPLSWKIGSWNVRSMVDTEGSLEMASQGTYGQRGEERKADLIVNELKRYTVKVAALQETKWFGSEVYQVDRSVLLTSGRTLPAPGESNIRREGVYSFSSHESSL